MLCSSHCRSWAWEDAFLWHEVLQCVNQCFCQGSSFKTPSPGWSREWGLTILALCFLSKPQLSEFQTPKRKSMLTTNDTVFRMVQADSCGSSVPPLWLNFVTMGAFTAESAEASITYRTFRQGAVPRHGGIDPWLQHSGGWNRRIVAREPQKREHCQSYCLNSF